MYTHRRAISARVCSQVPYMRNYFKDNNKTKWTITLWVKRDADNGGTVGLVDNGDCIDNATFLIYGGEDDGQQTAYTGIKTNGNSQVTTDDAVVS